MNAEVKKMTAEELKNVSLSDVLDLPLELIEEAVGFALPPIGSYFLTIKKCALGSIGAEGSKKEAIGLDLVINKTVELADTTQAPLPEGTEFSVNYISGGSLPYFKKDFGPIAAVIGATSLNELFQKLAGVQISCIITHNVNPTSKKAYPQLSEVTMV